MRSFAAVVLTALVSLLGASAFATAPFPATGLAPRGGGFAMDGYWVWDGSVVKGDDERYHMFVSRIPKNLTVHPGWMAASEVVHAVSDTLAGPYQFSDVVLPARGAQFWDGRSTHNATKTWVVAIPLEKN